MRKFLCLALLWVSHLTLAESIGPSFETLQALSKQAETADYQGAVILSKVMRAEVDPKGLETYRMYVAIKLLDEEAERDYSKLSTGFNAYYINRKLDFARVIGNDGSIKNISDDAIQVTNDGANNSSFDDIQTLRFAVPAVKKGNIIEIQHSSTTLRPIVDGQWFSSFPLQYIHTVEERNWARIDAVMHSDLRVKIAKNLQTKWQIQQLNNQPQIKNQSDYLVYHWQFTDIPAVKIEANMGNYANEMAIVNFTSVANWAVLDTWANGFLSEKIDVNQQLIELANNIVKGANSQQQKVKAVFDYVQKNIRYIGAHVGRGGYVPHKSTKVLEQSYGDCKDQSVLIVALLRQVGVEAFPALISPGPTDEVEASFAQLQFSHMITYIPGQDGEDIWLDTSGSTGNYPGIFGNLEGQTAFVLDGKGGSLKTIKVSQPSDNRAELLMAYKKTAQELDLTATLTLFGHMDTSIRNMYIANPDRMDFIRRFMSPFVGDAGLKSFTTSDIEDWQVPFEITMQYEGIAEASDELESFNFSDDIISMINSFTEFSYLTEPQDKVHGFSLAFPFELVFKRQYPNIIDNGELAATQLATEFDRQFTSFKHQVEQNDGVVNTTSRYTVRPTLLSVEQYADFFAEVQQIKQDGSSYFIFSNRGTQHRPKQEDSVSPEALIAHARQLLNIGEFAKALEVSEKLVGLAPDRGEAHYLLGLSAGFVNQYERSDKAFDQADALGYVEDDL